MIKSPFHICASENLLRIGSGDYSHLSVHTRSDQQEVFTHGKTSERMSEGLGEGPANTTQRWLDIWLYTTEFSPSPGAVILFQCQQSSPEVLRSLHLSGWKKSFCHHVHFTLLLHPQVFVFFCLCTNHQHTHPLPCTVSRLV